MRVRLLQNRPFAPGIVQTAGSVIQVGDDDGAAMIAAGTAEWVPPDTACMKDPTGWVGCQPPPAPPTIQSIQSIQNKLANRAAKGASKHAQS